MRQNHSRASRAPLTMQSDPRETHEAEIIDLATRNVLPVVAHRGSKSDGWGMAAGISIVAALGAITLWGMNTARTVKPAASYAPRHMAPMPASALPVPGSRSGPTNAILPPLDATPAQPRSQAAIAAPPQIEPAMAPAPNALTAPTVVFDASALPAPALPAPAASSTTSSAAGDDFANRIGGVGGSAATAQAMIDPRTTVAQGTLIPAVLETAINTDVPGYARAVVSADVRSFDNSRVLIPRFSHLIGQYKSGLQAGQKRAYVIWTRLIRPDGVSVNIASPATTFSGETGLSGSVNSHFFERFGSAMLLSLVGGLSTLGGGNGATAIVAGGGQSAAAAAVGQSGQIGPTIRVRQGEPIRVFTARDLDFSKVSTE